VAGVVVSPTGPPRAAAAAARPGPPPLAEPRWVSAAAKSGGGGAAATHVFGGGGPGSIPRCFGTWPTSRSCRHHRRAGRGRRGRAVPARPVRSSTSARSSCSESHALSSRGRAATRNLRSLTHTRRPRTQGCWRVAASSASLELSMWGQF
jgi:hypothetical protein